MVIDRGPWTEFHRKDGMHPHVDRWNRTPLGRAYSTLQHLIAHSAPAHAGAYIRVVPMALVLITHPGIHTVNPEPLKWYSKGFFSNHS